MNIFHNVPLADYTTMHLGGPAAHLAEIHDRNELLTALGWAEQQHLKVIMIGGGSNTFWRDEGFKGLVIINKISRYEDFAEDEENHYITIGAGENWDKVVERSVEAGLTGIEALSLVPGTAGATPIQNVGAYGQEISNTLVSVEAFDTQTKSFVTLAAIDCGFGYRTSRFKTTDKGRFFITAITLHLMLGNPSPPFYEALQRYLNEHDLHDFTPKSIREAVIAIRSSKLPDPALVSNNGSFFANPLIEAEEVTQLHDDFPDLPYWQQDDGRAKVSAAWLIDQAGFRDVHDKDTGMATWPAQPLVLVNEHARSTADLLKFKQSIVDTVHRKYGITLEQEPELLP